jgi:hypothetical protein
MTTKVKRYNPTNPKHFEGKSAKELQTMLSEALEFSKRHPQFQYGWHNEYIQELRKRIADTVGRGR